MSCTDECQVTANRATQNDYSQHVATKGTVQVFVAGGSKGCSTFTPVVSTACLSGAYIPEMIEVLLVDLKAFFVSTRTRYHELCF